jgi:hypothetical protein
VAELLAQVVLDGAEDVLGIELEGLLEFGEGAEEIDDEAAGLAALAAIRILVLEGPVDAGQGLQEDMVAHGLVQVHA